MDTSSEEELSDEEYIPQSESDSQSDSSGELTTRTERQDQANHPSQLQKVVPYKSSSDVSLLDLCQVKGKQVLKSREAEFDLHCHEEDLERDSDSGSDLSRVTDVVMASPSSVSEEACSVQFMNAADGSKVQEKGQSTNMLEADQCVQSSQISCSANSKNYCYICGKPQSKLARHLKTHTSELEVGKALSLPVHSKERKAMFQKLRNKGNYQHNTDVLQRGDGALKMKRAPKKEKDAKDFVHCMYCKGMFVRRDLWRHLRRCPSKPRDACEEQGRTRVLGLATMAESTFSQQISQGVWKLLGVMKQDDISVVVKNDWNILQLAQSFFNKHGHDPTKFEYI
ncbi:uncharacterized protein LOC130430457 [Triplophysa dalaica]|uniref:uncharacterized protein LOC130430457 n=1 Tax=Triplophysa dalaica TaxID=1582913 RepID=UPI0024DFA766|nr:uncharacterized protein LOC130430457 [Triplophysa dalaica]